MIKDKIVDITPELGKFYELVLPSMGHSQTTACGDLVDNAEDAAANEVRIVLVEKNDKLWRYMFVDNGDGMDWDELIESNRVATNSAHKPGDNGKFGAGGSIASFTLGEEKITFTRNEVGGVVLKSFLGRKDLEAGGTGGCTVGQASPDEVKMFDELLENSTGTIIIVNNLRSRQEYSRAHTFAAALAEYFGVTYYKKLEKKFNLTIQYLVKSKNKTKEILVKPFNPIYFDSDDMLHSKREEKVPFSYVDKNGNTLEEIITLQFAHMNSAMLPPKSGLVKNHGMVLERNDRIIARRVLHPKIWSRNPHYNAAGVIVSFTDALDEAFGVTVTKNNVEFSEDIVKAIEPAIKAHLHYVAEQSRSGSDETPEVAELKKEDEAFNKKLAAAGASIGLPHEEVVAKGGTQTRNSTGNKPGTVNPKGTPRRQSGTRKKYKTPRYEYLAEPRVPGPAYYYLDEEGEMVIRINTANPFIEKNYMKGTENNKNTLRVVFAGIMLSRYEYFGASKEEETVEAFLNYLGTYLTDVYTFAK